MARQTRKYDDLPANVVVINRSGGLPQPHNRAYQTMPTEIVCHGDCGRTLPFTPEYFYREPKAAYGLVYTCKECQKAQAIRRYHLSHGADESDESNGHTPAEPDTMPDALIATGHGTVGGLRDMESGFVSPRAIWIDANRRAWIRHESEVEDGRTPVCTVSIYRHYDQIYIDRETMDKTHLYTPENIEADRETNYPVKFS